MTSGDGAADRFRVPRWLDEDDVNGYDKRTEEPPIYQPMERTTDPRPNPMFTPGAAPPGPDRWPPPATENDYDDGYPPEYQRPRAQSADAEPRAGSHAAPEEYPPSPWADDPPKPVWPNQPPHQEFRAASYPGPAQQEAPELEGDLDDGELDTLYPRDGYPPRTKPQYEGGMYVPPPEAYDDAPPPQPYPPTFPGQDDPYRGRRVVDEPKRGKGMLIGIIAGIVVVAVAVGATFFLLTGRAKQNNTAAPGGSQANGPNTGQKGNQPAPSNTGKPARFGPKTFEAEATGNKLAGTAAVGDLNGASGGKIVRNIGLWDPAQAPGTLKFENVVVPTADTYTLVLFHVSDNQDPSRTAIVTVTGVDKAFIVTVPTGDSKCCQQATIQVPLKEGANTITVANASSRAPSIDKIVLTLQ
jgi:hypothetical protein